MQGEPTVAEETIGIAIVVDKMAWVFEALVLAVPLPWVEDGV
jgi:hypothetical protein